MITSNMEVVTSDHDIRIGLSKYRYPPNHDMLFVLNDNYRYITMKGMSFPIDVIFMDSKWNVIGDGWIRMYIGSDNIPIPQGTLYVLEVPVRHFA